MIKNTTLYHKRPLNVQRLAQKYTTNIDFTRYIWINFT